MEWRAAYFITFTCYGARLHGDERGSVVRGRNGRLSEPLAPNLDRVQRERHLMNGPSGTLDARRRAIATDAATEVLRTKGWRLFALHVRTNHVHLVAWANAEPEFVMRTVKAWITRRLREAALLGPEERLWTRHGSTRYLWNNKDLANAVSYVVESQGADIGWPWVASWMGLSGQPRGSPP